MPLPIAPDGPHFQPPGSITNPQLGEGASEDKLDYARGLLGGPPIEVSYRTGGGLFSYHPALLMLPPFPPQTQKLPVTR